MARGVYHTNKQPGGQVMLAPALRGFLQWEGGFGCKIPVETYDSKTAVKQMPLAPGMTFKCHVLGKLIFLWGNSAAKKELEIDNLLGATKPSKIYAAQKNVAQSLKSHTEIKPQIILNT